MPVFNAAKIDLYDVINKVVIGVCLLTFSIICFSPESGLYKLLIGSSALSLIILFPLSYFIGTILQGISSKCFFRGRHFQEKMMNARNSSKLDRESMEVEGGVHIHSFVWADLLHHFELDSSFMDEKKKVEYDTEELEFSKVYTWICYPMLKLAAVISGISPPQPESTRRRYGAEGEAFSILRRYADRTNLGDVHRFEILYVFHRTATLLVCVILVEYLAVILLILTDIHQPLASIETLSVLSALLFLVLPTLYSGMLSYDTKRDNRLISAYYEQRIKDSKVSNEGIID